ncbi:MAG: alkaline phosphatase family protein [Armatimonadetes bacterium]|nr:alkaline phosphatase family protein [Armatimonadota bacterium]
MSRRTIIIGIDGAPFSLIDELIGQGVMPCLGALAADGVFGPMRSSLPAVSSVSWSSIITGANPAEHGIYGFSELIPGSYTVSYPNFLSLKRPVFWRDRTDTCVVVNVPFTYPAQPLNGCLISGFVAPKLEKAVYPYSELATIERMGYVIDVDAAVAGQSELALYNQLFDTHAKREQVADYLWERYRPDLFMLVFTGSDRLGHFAWHHWEQADHPDHDRFLEYFRRVDAFIGHVVERVDEDDPVVVLSDHGMEGSAYEVNLNAYLIEGGFLHLDDDESRKYARIREGSVAFALEDGRIYLHERERFPKGAVDAADRDDLVAQLTDFLGQLRIDGRDVVKQVHHRDDIYHGDELAGAPHLVVEANPSFKLMGRLTTELQQPSRLPGMHNDEAFLLVRAPEAAEAVPAAPSVEDIVSIVQRCSGGE